MKTSFFPISPAVRTRLKNLLAGFLALVLCFGLLPNIAYAENAEGDTANAEDASAIVNESDSVDADGGARSATEDDVATLTIVAGGHSDWNTGEATYTTWVNKNYAIGSGATIKTLLDAAVKAGDIKSYDSSPSSYGGESLNAITSSDGVTQTANYDNHGFSVYWAIYANGRYGEKTFDLEEVVPGGKYQLAWTSYTSVSTPSSVEAWDAYYAENAPVSDGASESNAATLSIVAGSTTDWETGKVTYTTWVNKSYPFSDGATVKDLLNAAVTAGDIKAYDSSPSSYGGESLNSITSAGDITQEAWYGDDGLSLYWAFYINGGYASTTFDQQKVAAGGKYQLAWTAYSSILTPTNEAEWNAYYEKNVPDAADMDSDPAINPIKPPQDSNVASGIDEAQLQQLALNVAASYAGTTDAWKVMELAACGKLDTVDKQAFISKALSEMKSTTTTDDGYITRYQRNIIALSAIGVDAAAIPDASEAASVSSYDDTEYNAGDPDESAVVLPALLAAVGKDDSATVDGNGDNVDRAADSADSSGIYNAIDAMAKTTTASSPLNVRIVTLLAYASGPYSVPADANLSEEALINSIVASQMSNGGFALTGGTTSSDITALAISALIPYSSKYPQAANAANKALEALKASQLADGGFGEYANSDKSNTNSTALAATAMAAAGVDPASQWATSDGKTPMSALLSFAKQDASGFTYDGVDDPRSALATEQGFRALIAAQGLKNTAAPYNIYTQAKFGQATFDGSVNSQGQQTAGNGGMPQTGDSLLAAIFALLVLIALAGVFMSYEYSRKR